MLLLLPPERSIPARLELPLLKVPPPLLFPSGSEPDNEDMGPNVPILNDDELFKLTVFILLLLDDVLLPPSSSPPLESLSDVLELVDESAALFAEACSRL